MCFKKSRKILSKIIVKNFLLKLFLSDFDFYPLSGIIREHCLLIFIDPLHI